MSHKLRHSDTQTQVLKNVPEWVREEMCVRVCATLIRWTNRNGYLSRRSTLRIVKRTPWSKQSGLLPRKRTGCMGCQIVWVLHPLHRTKVEFSKSRCLRSMRIIVRWCSWFRVFFQKVCCCCCCCRSRLLLLLFTVATLNFMDLPWSWRRRQRLKLDLQAADPEC